MKIVIIEDDKDVASFLELAVQNLGYETAVSYTWKNRTRFNPGNTPGSHPT